MFSRSIILITWGVIFLVKTVHINGLIIPEIFKNNNTKREITIKNDLTDAVRDIVSQNDQNYGDEWSYGDLVEQIQKKCVSFANIYNNNDMIIALDNNYSEYIDSSNLHVIKSFPHLTSKIIDLLSSQHIPFSISTFNNNISFIQCIMVVINTYIIFICCRILFMSFQSYNMRKYRNNKLTTTGFTGVFNQITNLNSNIVNPNNIAVKFDDVAGCNEAKHELMEVVHFLKNPDKFNNAGACIPKGVLLEGNPGTGKTLLARATAGEAGVNFISASGSEFVEMFVGVGASRIRDIFKDARKSSPCIIFIDEIDAIGKQRGNGFSGGNDERDQTLNQLLTSMDGFEKDTDIIVMASTNRVDVLDKALLRPGRFDRKIHVPLPDRQGRKEILKVHLKNKSMSINTDLNIIYDLTPGFSGADLANLANEAAIMSVRYNLNVIDNKCFMDAYEKVTIGIPRIEDNRDTETLKMIAYHESGHAIVAKYFSDFVDVRKVTINANNNGAGGYTLFTPKERYVSFPTKKYIFANMVIAMGGRAAETLLYDTTDNDNIINPYEWNLDKNESLDVTLGSSNDVRRAMELSKQYINVFGIEDSLGSGILPEEQSDNTKDNIDLYSGKLISQAQKSALDILTKKITDLHNLSNLLTKVKTVDSDNFP